MHRCRSVMEWDLFVLLEGRSVEVLRQCEASPVLLRQGGMWLLIRAATLCGSQPFLLLLN